jgi:hypothetical protein
LEEERQQKSHLYRSLVAKAEKESQLMERITIISKKLRMKLKEMEDFNRKIRKKIFAQNKIRNTLERQLEFKEK